MSKLDKAKRFLRKIDKKHGSKIMLATGIISGVAAIGTAIYGTVKAVDIIDNHNAYREKIDKELPDGECDPESKKKVVRKLYLHTGVEIAKAYSPMVGFALCSGAMTCKAYGREYRDKVGMIAAYNGLDAMFKGYRQRISEKIGEEEETNIFNGIKHEKVVDPETKKKIEQVVLDPNNYSIYSRFFDECNPCWKNDPHYNLMWLKTQQSMFNDKLKRDGVIFLNDVYEALGFERVPAGQSIGWALQAGHEFLDFGMYDGNREKVRDFVNGYEPSVLLTFPDVCYVLDYL